jgi:gluconokinase
MILYLYGMPGAGKNYIGEILKKKYDFFFQDADQYLTKEMKEKLKNGQHFTIKEVEYYHEIIAYKLIQLKLKYKNIVVSQASLFQKHRNIVKALNPEIVFVHINANIETILERIKKRKGYVTDTYAKDLQRYLQIGEKDCEIKNDSNTTEKDILQQFLDISIKKSFII